MSDAYEAAAKLLVPIHPADRRLTMEERWETCDQEWYKQQAKLVVDAFLEASGIDPDKTYYEVADTSGHWYGHPPQETLDRLVEAGVRVEVGKEDT